ncbi:hypothetical protein [Robiginitalea sp. IMCC43444]|uniref:hypothetical protein n=1 Tax=Robiginitalea sp. IMCC43444 TaxID=3459121 RepID=UPI004043393A
MKKFLKQVSWSLLLIGALSFTACQEEFEEVNTSDAQGESFMASSNTAVLIEKTAQRDGSFDNIVDGSSCFALNFPYTVNVNGLDITIDSIEDLRLIEEIFDEFDEDVDVLEIFFPITITLADHTELVINNKEELVELARDCIEGGGDDDIECIDFVYPVTFYTFDINNQQTGQVTVNSDRELKYFLDELEDDDIISIDFPITLIKFDGTEVRVDNNAQLAAALEIAKDECDEDDDDDYNDDDFTLERLEHVLVECPWVVLSVERDGVNQSDQYEAYLMNFFESGEVTVKDRAGNVLNGTWEVTMLDHYAALNLSFDVLVDFTLQWKVYELEEGKIKLFSGDGNRIIMRSICDSVDTDPNTLREILRECAWIIKRVKNDGEEIDRLIGWEFKFQAENVVTLSNGVNTINGTWEIGTNAQGILVLNINMPEDSAISFQWPLRELLQNRLRFEIESIDYELTLLRACPSTNDGDITEIRSFLMMGDWMVDQYIDSGMEETINYEGMDFTFETEHRLIVSTNMDPLKTGFWRVIRDNDGKLKVYLNLGDDNDALSEFTDDWDIYSITEGRIELRDESGDGTVDILVFKRNP